MRYLLTVLGYVLSVMGCQLPVCVISYLLSLVPGRSWKTGQCTPFVHLLIC